ncbi:MAG: hypothetical protein WCP23_05505 [Planctomycetota bacterium]|nr:hypothetical protein [Planctomycetia bacterium]
MTSKNSVARPRFLLAPSAERRGYINCVACLRCEVLGRLTCGCAAWILGQAVGSVRNGVDCPWMLGGNWPLASSMGTD